MPSADARIAVSAGVVMLVLDDKGVVFSEPRQELFSLNGAAAFIWCLLEEGDPPERIVERYAQTFAVSRDDARQHVYPTLRHWFALGHISEPHVSSPSTTPLTTALAWLLTNGTLRNAFRASPQRMCDALGIRPEEGDAFLGLVPDALDAQSAEVATFRARQRRPPDLSELTFDDDVRARAAKAIPAFAAEPRVRRRYRLLHTIFDVHIPSEIDGQIHDALQHLEAAGEPDVIVRLQTLDRGCFASDGTVPLMWCADSRQLMPRLQALFRRIAVERHRYFIEIHAGVLRIGGRGLLLSGAAGQGKTTLTAALAANGATYFSDEVALLEERTLDVAPMPFAMTIKAGSVEPLRSYYPQLASLPEHLRDDHRMARALPPPAAARAGVDAVPCEVQWIVFPRYDAGVDTSLIPVGAAEGLRRLLSDALVLPELLDCDKVARLISWVRGRSFFELPFSSVDEAVRIIGRLKEGL
jgi:hypothetical protein